MNKDLIKQRSLKDGLVAWAKNNEIKAATFASKMEYSYSHAWSLLRGKRDFTPEALGRFVLSYGTGQAQELLDLASVHNDVNIPAQDEIIIDSKGE